jgi:hypothetical protein
VSSIRAHNMTGLEGPALAVGVKAGIVAAERFFKTTEFDRLCARLAERFEDRVPYSARDYARWAENDAFAVAVGKYLQPPHEFDRQALVTAITPLVGRLDSDTPAESFAAMIADAIRDELRLAKEGDALVRLEADRVIGAVKGIAQTRADRTGESELASAAVSAESVLRVAPQLSIGQPRIEGWQKISVEDRDGGPISLGRGRLIRVPVTNAQGVDTARHVHAQLKFLPNDMHRSFAPTHPTRGEWFSDHGPETEINLPGNGAARLLDVVVVLDRDYPHAYEWTAHSRAAGLVGYEIKAVPFDVEVLIMGSADTPTLRRTLQVECRRGHMIRADWLDKTVDEPTNWVPW